MAAKPKTAEATKAAAEKRKQQRVVWPDHVAPSALAKLLKLTTRRVEILRQEGVLTAGVDGKLPLKDSIEKYIAYREATIEKKIKVPTSHDLLREQRRLDLERKMAREDRVIITLDEAMVCVDEIIGVFLTALTGLPARITRKPIERQRLEKIFDEVRQRLSERFAKIATKLRTGQQDAGAEPEDDA